MRILLPTFHVRPSPQAIPLAAGCLKASLPRQLREQTLLLNFFSGQSRQDQVATILGEHPQVVAFPLYLWNRQEVLQLCRELRRRQADIFLLAGGPEASADSRQVIAEGQLNGVIRGEGELPFAQLMEALCAGQSNRSIPGYCPAENLNEELCPAVSCADLSRLPSPWLQGDLVLDKGGGVLWEIARGCHFNCAFCYDAKGHQGVRAFPEARLRAELELFSQHQVDQIWVLDSTFNAPPERGKWLLELLLERAPQCHFHFEAKADFLDQQTAKLLSRLSCSVQIGLQSATAAVLQPLRRSFQPEKMEKQLTLLSSAGITFGLDLIYGLPGDNYAGFCGSLDFALKQRPNQVDIFPLAVLPGTELHRQRQQFGINADPGPPYLVSENRTFPAEQLEQSRKLAAAADIFYNRGRAVGFFYQLCEALGCAPSRLLEDFAHWFERLSNPRSPALLAADRWQPEAILPLQMKFVKQRLGSAGQEKLLPLAADLMQYHYLYAEALLATDCRAQAGLPAASGWWKNRWNLNPQVRVHGFQHDVKDLEMRGGEPWSRLVKQLRREPSYGIFLRQHGVPVTESLQPAFARLLLGSTGRKTAAQLLDGVPRNEAEELLRFAVTEGLLWPAT